MMAESRVLVGHALVVPFPTPGHINPLLRFSKLLHSLGFHITFVITRDVHDRLVRSGTAPPDLEPADRFRIEVVSEGLGRRKEGMEYIRDLTVAAGTTLVSALRERVAELEGEHGFPRITCMIAGLLGPALKVAEEKGVPALLFWTTSAIGFMGTLHMKDFVERGYVPLKDGSPSSDGFLDTIIDWIPGLKPLRLRDISSLLKATDPEDVVYVEFHKEAALWASRARGVILNTSEELEHEAIEAMRPRFKSLHTIGPVSALCDAMTPATAPLGALKLSFWEEDRDCLAWLDEQQPGSVLYVNFGSLAVIEAALLREIALGVARSSHPFLWIVRPDLVTLDPASLTQLKETIMEEAQSSGLVRSWCPQEEVLAHRAIGGFLTHAGWNSMLESLRRGVPMLCWPMHVDQLVNCRYACDEWGVAAEIGEGEVERGRVESLVRELMGSGGSSLRENARKWKVKLEESTAGDQMWSSSRRNFEDLVKTVMSCEGGAKMI